MTVDSYHAYDLGEIAYKLVAVKWGMPLSYVDWNSRLNAFLDLTFNQKQKAPSTFPRGWSRTLLFSTPKACRPWARYRKGSPCNYSNQCLQKKLDAGINEGLFLFLLQDAPILINLILSCSFRCYESKILVKPYLRWKRLLLLRSEVSLIHHDLWLTMWPKSSRHNTSRGEVF